jgi:bacterioferritin
MEYAMKGGDRILASLTNLMADERTAINQYMVQFEMCANWGCARLHKTVERDAIEEMQHAEKLIAGTRGCPS